MSMADNTHTQRYILSDRAMTEQASIILPIQASRLDV